MVAFYGRTFTIEGFFRFFASLKTGGDLERLLLLGINCDEKVYRGSVTEQLFKAQPYALLREIFLKPISCLPVGARIHEGVFIRVYYVEGHDLVLLGQCFPNICPITKLIEDHIRIQLRKVGLDENPILFGQ